MLAQADREHAGDSPEPDSTVGGVAAAEPREDERAEDPADQAAHVAADRDAGDREAEDQVDQDQAERRAAEHVVPLPLEDQCRAEQAEERPGGADGRAQAGCCPTSAPAEPARAETM